MLNLDLLAHPANWVIIFLTLYFVAMLAHVVYTAAASGSSPIPLPFNLS